jgi:phosphatidylserine decarboxylase
MLLTPYGAREWITGTVVCAVLAVPVVLIGWWWLLIPIGLIWIMVAGFFRDPLGRRPASDDERDWISPADGRITVVEVLDHHEATEGPALLIRIFLSVLDVHINRAPCNASVREIRYRPGKWLDARSEESAKVNESNLVLLETEHGLKLGVRQVSGAIARRIVCPLKSGDTIKRGERWGMIKFGSTTELIVPFPENAEARVKVGDKVRGGVTILARIGQAASPKPQSAPSS